MLHFIANFCSI
ncbi:hypothetical protein BpHYR1_002300 [Brachionus plicatilis]|uniref:Uncharacterized protein n=1 Tax=Brachionus plicatilis TaxID=10195 RepID=A0A3M7QE68_BRAPC|nr:hypothetical protein BpHYR1_002300 [Brachionus plicatilis]